MENPAFSGLDILCEVADQALPSATTAQSQASTMALVKEEPKDDALAELLGSPTPTQYSSPAVLTADPAEILTPLDQPSFLPTNGQPHLNEYASQTPDIQPMAFPFDTVPTPAATTYAQASPPNPMLQRRASIPNTQPAQDQPPQQVKMLEDMLRSLPTEKRPELTSLFGEFQVS
ncbi:hypothetical protein HDV00_009934 [Rhizophlyctis rosea]|nr:hypothetical protein HDV00_009934 [Rhizophlyctis rosea]